MPLDRLAVDEKRGSKPLIRSLYAGHEWQGQVVRTTGRVSGQARMAGVIIEVPNPLGLESDHTDQALLLDDQVEALITGKPLAGVYALLLSPTFSDLSFRLCDIICLKKWRPL